MFYSEYIQRSARKMYPTIDKTMRKLLDTFFVPIQCCASLYFIQFFGNIETLNITLKKKL